ncbi:5402_t:CDS:10 [Diversispora eburnea]|uniref:DNA topoisomerase I n=1 Tax=Diversispora eburnea TaxID=1213867 RepID=A0A9N9B3D6_9GLOM|nr:5402_t:CDS:10 [Diversispora eburnea]
MKIIFISSSVYTLYLMKKKFRATYDPNTDTFRIEYLLALCLFLGLMFNYKFTVMEAVAILPQLFMLSRTGEAETITTHYLFALGAYRGIYLLNWVWRYNMEGYVDWIVWIAGASVAWRKIHTSKMGRPNGKKVSTTKVSKVAKSKNNDIKENTEKDTSESDSEIKVLRRRPKRIMVSESEDSENEVVLTPKATKSSGSNNKTNVQNSLIKDEKLESKLVKRMRIDSESEGNDKNIEPKNDSKKLNNKKATIKKEEPNSTNKKVSATSTTTITTKAKTIKQEAKTIKQEEKTFKQEEKTVKQEAKTVKQERKRNDSDSDSEYRKLASKSRNRTSGTKSRPERKKKKEDNQADVEISEKKRGKQKETKEASDAEVEQDSEDEDDEFKWWQQNADNDGTVKWNTLEHNGVYFPPPYEPHNVRMKYDGKEVTLTPEAEEVASFYAAMLGTDYNPPIKDFKKCDFSPIYEFFEKEKERKKNLSKEEKAAIKEEKKKLEEKYGFCVLDGRREKVGNFRIEPPGLFRGRGAHPKCGKLKQRVLPEQVTINVGKNTPVPPPPPGHKWKEVIHENTVTWLATWKENVNDNIKYVFLAANSSLKGQSDLKKFDKARELKKHIEKIRNDYKKELKDKLMATRQMATVIYLIDRLALRAGNEKNTKDEADTVGCCSLRVEHVTLKPPNTVEFDFLGKDSIRYVNTVEVEEQVFKNLRIFIKGKDPKKDMLFDRVNTQDLNRRLSGYMKGLTAKVFRTYNASYTFQTELKKLTDKNATVAEKILSYNRANRMVAILCNHQRSVSKAHSNQMNKIQDKKYSDLESDLEEDWIIEHEKQLMEKERERIHLQQMLADVDEKEKELIHERKIAKIQPKKGQTIEKLEAQIEKLDARIKETKLMMVDKDENKTTALGTSKINYIDPRISAAWCLKYNVPTEKIFNKSLRDKFKWAFDVVNKEWEF